MLYPMQNICFPEKRKRFIYISVYTIENNADLAVKLVNKSMPTKEYVMLDIGGGYRKYFNVLRLQLNNKTKLNSKPAKILATCLSNSQKLLLLFTSLCHKILNN